MDRLPRLPTSLEARAAEQAEAQGRQTVEQAFAVWHALAGDSLPAAAALANAVRPLRPTSPPVLDDAAVEQLALLAMVAERTATPIAFEAWTALADGRAQLIRAAILPARTVCGVVGVTAVFAAADVTASPPAAE